MNQNESEQLDKQYIGMASREKYWSELTIEEKIERTRLEVKRACTQLIDIQENIFELAEKFNHHEHLNGLIVTPIDKQPIAYGGQRLRNLQNKLNGIRIGGLDKPNEVYF